MKKQKKKERFVNGSTKNRKITPKSCKPLKKGKLIAIDILQNY